MCRRLEPILGDVRTALGPRWHEQAEALFTEADFAVADAALRASKAPDWFLIRYAPAGRRLDEEGDGMVCAASWSEAVAILLGACERQRCLPSQVSYDEDQRTLRLDVGGELLATVAPLLVDHVRPKLRQRALSTISGLRKSADPGTELLRRVRKWPGMAGVRESQRREPHDIQQFRERMAHHPIPREWLVSARLLCMACGRTDSSTAEVQAVAAAVLGAPSWNHVAAPFGDLCARLLQPWYLRKDDEPCAFHADAIDAVADLLARAPRAWIAGWTGAALESQYSFTALNYMPTYTLVEHFGDSTPAPIDSRQIAAWPVIRAEAPADSLMERVDSLTSRRSEDIATLFGIGLPVDVKARMLDERSQETLIVLDGRWRFTRTSGPTDKSTSIWVHCDSGGGTGNWSAAVPAYKGLLQTHRESGFYVLCADYDGAHPVAVIDGLSPLAAAQVRANLPDTHDDRMEFREENRRPRDLDRFRQLLERALLRRSTA